MFTQTEMEALLLGTRWVTQYGDAPLAKAAAEALNKINHVLPGNIKNNTNTFTLRVGPPAPESMIKEDLSILRDAIANQNKILLAYKSKNGKKTQQIVWPFTIGYFTDGRILVVWCDKRKNYQLFKTNQIISVKILEQRYPGIKENLFCEWQTLKLRKHSIKRK
jgi:predicted DNA-binding transcriptional regulator YafY